MTKGAYSTQIFGDFIFESLLLTFILLIGDKLRTKMYIPAY